MCTVTFLPLLSEGSYLLTSNRDEKISRALALEPQVYHIDNQNIFFPKDPKGTGSWIATNEQKATVCLLNGGFAPHQVKENYKHSRGLVPLHYFKFKDVFQFCESYEFADIEPFTLVIVHNHQLFQIVWDGTQPQLTELEFQKPHIWSSVTLYSSEVVKNRQLWFSQWLQNQLEITQEKAIDFHTFGGDGNAHNNLIMNRETGLQTISISSISHVPTRSTFIYRDLQINKTSVLNF